MCSASPAPEITTESLGPLGLTRKAGRDFYARFFHSKRFKILLGILAALMIGIIIAAASHGGASPSSSLLGAVFSPLQRLSAYVSEQIGNFSGGFVSAGTYAKEIDELKQQIADYQKKLVDYDEMKRQITSYESVLGVKEAHQDWEMAPASIIARDSSGFILFLYAQ